MVEAAVRVERLVKHFDSRMGLVRAVDGISFSVPRGLIFGLLGPNGAGKTTTIRLLATILRPTEGMAIIEGAEVTSDPEGVRRRIGYLSADTGLYGRLTPREMVSYYGRLYGMAEGPLARRVDELFRRLEILPYADRLNDKLSSGEKQRVSVARALVHDPPVLVMDEPTSALDVLASRQLVEIIREQKAAGKTVLFSSHNLLQAQKLCDEFAVIHRGRILAQGTVERLREETGRSDLEEIFVHLVERSGARA
jgi:sodium transport system ATP-binding protein